MFLGLTNSADDIIRDRAVLQRERNLNVRLSYYVLAKTVSLGVFALVQCILFVLIGNYILEIRGMFWFYLAIVFMTAMSGVSLGLVISSLVADPKTAANIVPLVLIPQIIMGGAMIKYEDMNRNLGLVYTFSRWFHDHPNSDETSKMDSRLQVPFICEFVAMRWSYEELVVAQAKLNPLTKRQEEAQKQIDAIVARHESNPGDSKRLDDLKETLAVLSGLEAHTPRELQQYLVITDRLLNGKMPFDRTAFKNANGPITAEQLYVNQKISDLIANAEMEQNDYRRGGKPNVFFGAQKHYFGMAVSVFTFNTVVLIGSSLLLLWLLHWILRRQLEVRRN
jgi:ABC transport system ATP-binding/permease protein